MTYEEAKKWCEDFTLNIITVTPKMEKKHNLALDSMVKCVEALEKQTPIKPVQHGKIGDDDCWFECSVCNEYITSYWTGEDNYCGNCGQAIDWSDD